MVRQAVRSPRVLAWIPWEDHAVVWRLCRRRCRVAFVVLLCAGGEGVLSMRPCAALAYTIAY